MKEIYWTKENIDIIAEDILRKASVYSKRHANLRLKPFNACLLVIDMQCCFLNEALNSFIPSAVPIKEKIKALINAFENIGLCVIFTRHVNYGRNSGLMKKWWKNLIDIEDPGSCIFEDILTPSPIVITKHQYDAFHNTALEMTLRKNNINQVIITGVMTNACCDTTARSAFVRGFEVYFAIDATAAANYDLHLSSVLSLSHCCAIPVSSKAILQELKGAGKIE